MRVKYINYHASERRDHINITIFTFISTYIAMFLKTFLFFKNKIRNVNVTLCTISLISVLFNQNGFQIQRFSIILNNITIGTSFYRFE